VREAPLRETASDIGGHQDGASIVFPPQSPPTQTSLQPLAVAPREACKLLSVGISTVYALMRSGELDSYADGKRMRRITTASIHAYTRIA
jgi:excisionase family DNA binding protein